MIAPILWAITIVLLGGLVAEAFRAEGYEESVPSEDWWERTMEADF